MKKIVNYKTLIRDICEGTYTKHDEDLFIEECILLAHPLIRQKIALGKIKLDFLDVKEIDLVYDCIADLLERDSRGVFIYIRRFFEHLVPSFDTVTGEELRMHLRRLVVKTVQQNIIKVYGDYDPVLAKILRNIKLAAEKSSLFDIIPKFNTTYLVPKHTDPLWSRSPLPVEELHQQFLYRSALKNSIPKFLKKLYDVLCGIETFQRAIPVISVALFYKELLIIEWNAEFTEAEPAQEFLHSDILHVINLVCKEIQTDAERMYVTTGKFADVTVQKYCNVLQTMLWDIARDGMNLPGSYFEYLQKEMPALSKEEYAVDHRSALEYLAKEAKSRFISEMKNL